MQTFIKSMWESTSRKGAHLQSVHACPCLRKVAQCRKEFVSEWSQNARFGHHFRRPWRPLCLLWRALGATLRLHSDSIANCGDFARKRTSAPWGPNSWATANTAFCTRMMLSPYVYKHSARRVPAQPQGKVASRNFSLLVSLQEP